MRILLVEDSADDAELLHLALQQGGLPAPLRRVANRAGLTAALADGPWDLMLCDNHLPDLDALGAIDLVREHAGGELPFPIIVMSGHLDLDGVLAAMRHGARDCIDKAALPRLIPVLERELAHARTARSLQQLERALHAQRTGPAPAPRDQQRRLRIEQALTQALARNEFSLHYQPQVDPASARIVAAEALLRWHTPELGPVSPMEFVPLLEDSGHIVDVSRWVLMEACRQLRAWDDAGLPAIDIAVNIPAQLFSHRRLIDEVAGALDGHGLVPRRLELEITEGTAVRDREAALEIMARIRRLGVRIAMDDFGVGYSSLGYLKHLPLDTLKIDRLFVADLEHSEVDRSLVRAIVAMGRSLGLQVIAEGVETAAQHAYLASAGCDLLQGYHLGRPQPAPAFAALLAGMPPPPAP